MNISRIYNKVLKEFGLENKRLPRIETSRKKLTGRPSVAHISAFSYGNAGDTLLPVALRDLFDRQTPLAWSSVNVHKTVTKEDVVRFNRKNGLIIGGGGLFLKDTNPNNLSGWQWGCSLDHLNAITAPMILFAVGYNRFRGQDEFAPVFKPHLNRIVEKAVFVGLRNHGSIENVRRYLREELHQKIRYQPCMTTVLSRLYPELAAYDQKEDFIALNCAFDRSHLRYEDKIGDKLTAIAKAVRVLSDHYPVKYYSHMLTDEAVLPFLDCLKVPYELVRLNNTHPREIIRAYAKPRLVIGMRGHAQMIPFGCNTPVLSIVSHEKMQWFLNDIHHPEWGVNILDADFDKKLLSSAQNILEHFESVKKELVNQQDVLWDISQANVAESLKALNR